MAVFVEKCLISCTPWGLCVTPGTLWGASLGHSVGLLDPPGTLWGASPKTPPRDFNLATFLRRFLNFHVRPVLPPDPNFNLDFLMCEIIIVGFRRIPSRVNPEKHMHRGVSIMSVIVGTMPIRCFHSTYACSVTIFLWDVSHEHSRRNCLVSLESSHGLPCKRCVRPKAVRYFHENVRARWMETDRAKSAHAVHGNQRG